MKIDTNARCIDWLSMLTMSVLLVGVIGGGCTLSLPSSTGTSPPAHSKHRPAEPSIRVLVHTNVRQFEVEVQGPYEIRQGNRVNAKGSKLAPAVVRYQDNSGSGPTGILIGSSLFKPQTLSLVPTDGHALEVRVTSDAGTASAHYDGYLEIHPLAQNRTTLKTLDLVNVIGIERYLPGVLQGELYPQWHIETYRAMAIAARTYALYQIKTTGSRRYYDVSADERSQVYRGMLGLDQHPSARRAVQDTRGLVCTWDSPRGRRVFCTYYSSACGGMTQAASNCLDEPTIPPLAGGVKCHYCQIGEKAYRWDPVRISKSEIHDLLKKDARFSQRYPGFHRLHNVFKLIPHEITPDGRPLVLEIQDSSQQSERVSSYDFRLAIGGHRLRSNHFQIADETSACVFHHGRGFGHAVGLCQWGAEGQARRGKTASEILEYYYPGSQLTRAY